MAEAKDVVKDKTKKSSGGNSSKKVRVPSVSDKYDAHVKQMKVENDKFPHKKVVKASFVRANETIENAIERAKRIQEAYFNRGKVGFTNAVKNFIEKHKVDVTGFKHRITKQKSKTK
jgi:hypothetical protein